MSYILFGAGMNGKRMLSILGSSNVACFIDSNIEVDEICDIPVYPPKEIQTYYHSGDEIIICTRSISNAIEMVDYLKSAGFNYRLMDDVARDVIHREAQVYNSMNPREEFVAHVNDSLCCPWDRLEENGSTGAYFWQDLWAARKILKSHPNVHYDIGSRIDGLIAHLISNNLKVKVIDIRDIHSHIEGLEYVCSDATKLDIFSDGEIESLSAVCSVEHFGLGRYNDEIDPEACFKFMNNIGRKMKPGGALYITVPIGKERVQFNAHRIFSPSTILNECKGFSLVEFSVYTDGRIIYNADLHSWDDDRRYGIIGLFHLIKEKELHDK